MGLKAWWDHPLQAYVAAIVMRFWGLQVEYSIANGRGRLKYLGGEAGWEFFVRYYDGRME